MTAIYREFVLRNPSGANALTAFLKMNAGAAVERGKPLRVIVTEDEKKRTDAMNRRYWGVVLKQISEQAWVSGRQFDKDVWHEHYARKHGVCDEMVLPDGEIILRRKSTTQMTVSEFSEYMQRVEADASCELGVMFDE